MNIKLRTLNIASFNEYDKRQIRFVKEIKNDPLVTYFVSRQLEEQLTKSSNDDDLVINDTYIILDKKNPIGFIRLARLNELGTLELHYGVKSECRKQGYGTKILLEVGDYLLANRNDVKKIKLDIKENNIASIKCAEKAKYHFDRAASYGYGETRVLTYLKERK